MPKRYGPLSEEEILVTQLGYSGGEVFGSLERDGGWFEGGGDEEENAVADGEGNHDSDEEDDDYVIGDAEEDLDDASGDFSIEDELSDEDDLSGEEDFGDARATNHFDMKIAGDDESFIEEIAEDSDDDRPDGSVPLLDPRFDEHHRARRIENGELCEACCRPRGTHATMSGCITLLQIWMWKRLPIGRLHQLDPPQPWFPQGDAVVAPTMAHLYERAHGTYHVSRHAYISFTNELDTLLPQHVEWRPYRRRQVMDLNLSSLCTVDEDVWTMRTPLICFYAVEYHLPHRVARQFGRLQPSPPEDFSTGWQLHKFSRQKKKKITNWQLEHQRYIDEWMLMEQNNMGIHAVHRDKAFNDYLVWLGQRTRLQLRPAWTEQDIANIASEDEGNNPYDQATREEHEDNEDSGRARKGIDDSCGRS
ncbi:serine/threonine-protein phosphatase 7 long form homolog [Miscanthus floridulus]|uniref:serine/threonine-protein phosphatase 7 long form homolog n=1 Tax=Miscanthus floridulus TaxID=154761 RepID=UPI003459B029